MVEPPKSSDTTGTVQFPVGFAAMVVAVIAVLSGFFFDVSQSLKETVIFLAAASAAGGTIITAYYIAKTLNLYLSQEARLRSREAALDEQGKKERALHYGARWNDPQMHWARDICRQLYNQKTASQAQVLAFIQGKNETNITALLNFFEEMAHAIENGLVDEGALKGQFAGHVIGAFQIAKPYVDQLRTQRARPLIWKPLEDLCMRWHVGG